MNRNLAISDSLKLPRDAVTSTLIVYGGKGMGKSNLGSVSLVEITTAGFDEVAREASGPPSATDLLSLWKSKFNAGARRMLELLVERHPKSYTRDELDEAAGIVAASGTFRNYLGDLRRADLVETNGAEVIASDDLFIGG